MTKAKMKKENDKISVLCMLSVLVSAIFLSELFTCKARSERLVRVPQRLLCEGKEACVEKKSTGPGCSPCIFATKKQKTKQTKNRYTAKTLPSFFFIRKSVFCTWDIPIVPYIRYQNALFCAHEMSRYAAGTSA